MDSQRFHLAKADIPLLKQKLLAWSKSYPSTFFLNSNDYESDSHSKYDCIVAVGSILEFNPSNAPDFRNINELIPDSNEWLFGFISYELKNKLHHIESTNTSKIDWPLYNFISPQIVITLKDSILEIETFINAHTTSELFDQINKQPLSSSTISKKEWISNFTAEEYIEVVNKIKEEIRDGNTYELNFCQEFVSQGKIENPEDVYWKLNELTEAPFSAFVKFESQFLLCCSPERFLAKRKQKLITQPIKGTLKRGENKEEDSYLKSELENSEKERAENIMIMDLCRNDLAQCCVPGSVKVDELCKVYPFKTVYQMISTISGQIKSDTPVFEAIANCFPMGSMTGAPKKRTMELIDHYERSKRTVFSGSIGYIDPSGDFDFNVLIRSLSYDDKAKVSSYHSGGAITIDSDAQSEYEESLLKAKVLDLL